jgi:hypothetical protein
MRNPFFADCARALRSEVNLLFQGGLLEVGFVDNVVAIKDGSGLVAEIIMATRSGTPARTMFRTAVLRKIVEGRASGQPAVFPAISLRNPRLCCSHRTPDL